MNKKTIIGMSIAVVVFFGIVYAAVSIMNQSASTPSGQKISPQQAQSEMSRLLKHIPVTNIQPRKAAVELMVETDLSKELPDVNQYPLTVEGRGQVNIEIMSSPEKAGKDKDGWLNEMARDFNAKGITINGMTASVSIRNIASGTATDYILSGKYLPDAFTPSNKLWGDIISASSTNIEMRKDRLVGNVAGVLIEQTKVDELKAKYGDVNLSTFIQATAANELAFGYTNPFTSSTGLNFLLSALYEMDPSNPLSATAAKGFEAFQANVPFVAYTTTQMKDAVSKTKSLDIMVQEYQAYQNTPELSKFTFIPFGIRHNNPIYAVGELSVDKSQLLDQFIEFCLTTESQNVATRYGFNGMNDYAGSDANFSGNTILAAQKLWKEKKDVGRPIIAVFVADVSGSMDGAPLNQLRESLINAGQYIDEKNQIGLVSYNDNVFVNLPIEPFNINQRAYFTGAVEDLSSGGGTATFNAVLVALNMLNEKKQQFPEAKPMLFVLSDGETNQGYKLNEVDDIIAGFGVPIYTIGYNADISALQKISSINEAATINATSDDVIYQLKNLLNAQM